MGVSAKDLMKREFECIGCSDRINMEVKKGSRAIRNFHCICCEGTRQFFATDVLKRIDKEENDE